MKMGGVSIWSCTALLLISTIGPASAGKHKFINFDVTDAHGTFGIDVNNKGDIAGFYWDNLQAPHGFVRMADGTITTFDVPDASSTSAGAINQNDEILGTFSDSKSVMHGFTRSPDGTITTFDPKGSTGTEAIAINDKGEITGGYYDENDRAHGFIRKPSGKFVIFDPAGASFTFGESINNQGVVAGAYCSSGTCDPYSAFVRSADGTITTFSVSGARMTIPVEINSQGEIAGFFATYDGERGGFLRTADGQIVTIDCGSITGLNDKGWAIGFNTDVVSGVNHGCLRAPDGTVSIFDDPKAGSSGIGQGTQPSGINGTRHVTGYFEDSAYKYHGFVVLPPK